MGEILSHVGALVIGVGIGYIGHPLLKRLIDVLLGRI